MWRTTEPNSVDKHIGLRVKLRRKVLGFMQDDFAAAAGLTVEQIDAFERGRQRIDAATLYRFTKVLDVPTTYFFHGVV